MSTLRRFALVAVVCAVPLALGAIASAQQPRGNRGGPGGPGMPGASVGKLMMLSNPAVQEELKLTARQKTMLEKSGESMHELFDQTVAEAQELAPEDRQQAFEGLEKKIKKLFTKVEGTFDASQKKRTKELSLQMRGALIGLQDPEVQTALKLSADQKKELKKQQESMAENMFARGPGFGPGPGGQAPGGQAFGAPGGYLPQGGQLPGGQFPGAPGPGGPGADGPPPRRASPDGAKSSSADLKSDGASARPEGDGPPPRGENRGRGPGGRFMELMKEQNDKALAVLTDDQKAAYEKMLGEKFEFRFGPPRGEGADRQLP